MRCYGFFGLAMLAFVLLATGAIAQDAATPSAMPDSATVDASESVQAQESADSMDVFTLMAIIKTGGSILWIIMALGFITIVMALYFFLTVTVGREVPTSFIKRAKEHLRAGDFASSVGDSG